MLVIKNYYELLGVEISASSEDIKRAFRKEIARYHPDKVQHLGREFQDIASVRSAELTEAYRILMDDAQRSQYDEQLRAGGAPPPVPAPAPAEAPAASPPEAGSPEVEVPPRPDAWVDPASETGRAFVRRVAVARFRDAVVGALDSPDSVPARDFDVALESRPRRTLFRRGDLAVRVLGRFVPVVDASGVHETWPLAVRVGPPADGALCVFLLGGGLAPQRELAAAIAEQRRKQPRAVAGLSLVPVDVRDWEALIPADAPEAARRIVERLRK